MKKHKFLLLILALCLTTLLVSCKSNNVDSNSYNNTENNVQNNSDNNSISNDNPHSNLNTDNQKNYNVTVSVTNKTNIPEDIYNGRYSDRVEFSFSITNKELKDIKGIKGTLKIKDLFGNSIIDLNCDFTGQKIAKSTSTTFTGIGIDINEFKSNHTKLYNEKYNDLNFEYEIQEVIYYGELTRTQTTYDEVVINVINKSNLAEDIYNGRYSPEVLFDFDIFNKSSKSIKGIQGVLVVYDLFGDEIIKINCDFTGKSISSKSSTVYNDMSIEINEFKDEHVSLYNEEYADLNFEYIVNMIVYTDGTTIEK